MSLVGAVGLLIPAPTLSIGGGIFGLLYFAISVWQMHRVADIVFLDSSRRKVRFRTIWQALLRRRLQEADLSSLGFRESGRGFVVTVDRHKFIMCTPDGGQPDLD